MKKDKKVLGLTWNKVETHNPSASSVLVQNPSQKQTPVSEMLAPSVLSFIIGEQTWCLIVHIRHDFDKPKILMYLSALAQRSLPST